MKLIKCIIIYSIFLFTTAYSKEKPPFKNILALDKPKAYKEIIFKDREGNQIDLNLISTELDSYGKYDSANKYLISQIESKFVIVAMKNEKVIKDMNVSELVVETSKNFGGGASKDQVLSVGGGPNDYSIDENLKYVKESIDYGERYVGLALKKQSINSAYAYKVLDSKSLDVLDEIKQSLIDHEIDEIVIGYPIGLNSHQTRMSNVVDEFIENDLKSITTIPIHKVDERMTSKLTNDKTIRNDDLAALEILNSHLKND